jgi:thymidine kinase
MSGNLEVIIGPMFSGKSSEILRKIRLYKKINKRVLTVKPKKDNRYIADKITTHNLDSYECMAINELKEIQTIIKDYDILVIDEGQFFTDLKEMVLFFINMYNINIIVAGLDGDYQRNPIGQILELIPHSDKCQKLTSLCNICNDGTEAPFTYRKVKSDNQILIGGEESYIPVCRKHYE